MATGPSLDFRSVCNYVGRLFLETQHELEQRDAQAAQLLVQLQAEQKKNAELEARVANGPAKS